MATAEQQVKRNKEIIALWKKGFSLAEIGRKFGLTRERVRQLVLASKEQEA